MGVSGGRKSTVVSATGGAAGSAGSAAAGGAAGSAGQAGAAGSGGAAALWQSLQCGWEQLGARVSPTSSYGATNLNEFLITDPMETPIDV